MMMRHGRHDDCMMSDTRTRTSSEICLQEDS